jgi:hypothetical protein
MRRCSWLLLVVAGCGFSISAEGSAGVGVDGGGGDGGGLDAPAPEIDAALPPEPVRVTRDFPSVADTFLASDALTYNFGSQPTALVDGDIRRTILMRFDLSSIPPDAEVESSTLHVWTDFDEGRSVVLYALLQDWSESQATWNRRRSGEPWANAGAGAPGSRASKVIGSLDPKTPYTAYSVAFDAETVAGWVAEPSSNHGISFVTTNSDGTRFATREHPNASMRPFLRVTYVQ